MFRTVRLERTRRQARAAAFALLGLAPFTAHAAGCDRDCLGALLTQYVDAVVAHDPTGLPVAAGLRVTEDSQPVKLGEGIWKTVTAKGTFRQDYLDTRKQVAATHVQLLEGTNQLLYSVLLYVKDRKITGVETLVERVTPESRFQPKVLGKPLAVMNDPVPKAKRQSRAAMIRTYGSAASSTRRRSSQRRVSGSRTASSRPVRAAVATTARCRRSRS